MLYHLLLPVVLLHPAPRSIDARDLRRSPVSAHFIIQNADAAAGQRTFHQVDEKIRLVEIVAEPEVEFAQRHGAAVPSRGTPLLLQARRRMLLRIAAGSLAMPAIGRPVVVVVCRRVAMSVRRTVPSDAASGRLLVHQSHVDGRLAFVQFRLECSCFFKVNTLVIK